MEQLGINLYGLIGQIVNFGILLALLTVLLFKPVQRMLEKRSAKIREGLEQAEEMKVAAERAQAESAALIEQSRKEGQAIIARAEQIAARIKEDTQATAKEEAQQFLVRAKAEIELDKQRAISDLRAQVADIAISAASRIVGQSLDKTAHYKIIEEALDQAKLKG